MCRAQQAGLYYPAVLPAPWVYRREPTKPPAPAALHAGRRLLPGGGVSPAAAWPGAFQAARTDSNTSRSAPAGPGCATRSHPVVPRSSSPFPALPGRRAAAAASAGRRCRHRARRSCQAGPAYRTGVGPRGDQGRRRSPPVQRATPAQKQPASTPVTVLTVPPTCFHPLPASLRTRRLRTACRGTLLLRPAGPTPTVAEGQRARQREIQRPVRKKECGQRKQQRATSSMAGSTTMPASCSPADDNAGLAVVKSSTDFQAPCFTGGRAAARSFGHPLRRTDSRRLWAGTADAEMSSGTPPLP
jgi:hypothetical protein